MFSLLINASTIRPLIKMLGIDKLTDDEQEEFRHGLQQAEENANGILNKFHQTGLISRGTQKLIQTKNRELFASDLPEQDDKKEIRHLYISALRLEIGKLKYLYDIGIIQYYIYLDIKNNIQRDRENWSKDTQNSSLQNNKGKQNYFVRFENALLKRLREHDWATGLLSRYQYMRFSYSLQRDMAGVFICNEVLEEIDNEKSIGDDVKGEIVEIYQARLKRRLKRINNVSEECPDFFKRFITRLLTKVSLNVANEYAQQAYQHGEVGSKAYASIERIIKSCLSSIPPISEPPPKLQPCDLIGTVPLLNGLSDDLLQRLADHAQSVTFLANDIVIGEGEKGDALYLLTHGHVIVYREQQADKLLAELKDGDFFGEMALLGDQVRTAIVKAITPTTLLRLRRKDVLALAEIEPFLRERLEDADDVRRNVIEHD